MDTQKQEVPWHWDTEESENVEVKWSVRGRTELQLQQTEFKSQMKDVCYSNYFLLSVTQKWNVEQNGLATLVLGSTIFTYTVRK